MVEELVQLLLLASLRDVLVLLLHSAIAVLAAEHEVGRVRTQAALEMLQRKQERRWRGGQRVGDLFWKGAQGKFGLKEAQSPRGQDAPAMPEVEGRRVLQ